MRLLKTLFGFDSVDARRKARAPRKDRKVRGRPMSVEQLEAREVLTAKLYLDFGNGIGMGNTISPTVNEMAAVFGTGIDESPTVADNYGTGPYLVREGLGDLNTLAMTPLNYDFDGSGGQNNDADITALANAVKAKVELALEPFNIEVVIVGANSLTSAKNIALANNADTNGTHDAYIFAMSVTSDFYTGANKSVGSNRSLYGIAATEDLWGGPHAGVPIANRQDEAALVFTDFVFSQTPGSGATFRENLASRIAYTATHEAFHTFGSPHSGWSSNTDQLLLSTGDVIRLGSTTRDQPFTVTRFPLSHEPNSSYPGYYAATENVFEYVANSNNIGLKDSDGDGKKDLVYITGTGAHDKITLTKGADGVVGIQVKAFRDFVGGSEIQTIDYAIDLDDYEGMIRIDAGFGNDFIYLPRDLEANVTLRGGAGSDQVEFTLPSSGFNQPVDGQLVFNGGTRTLFYAPGGDAVEKIVLLGDSANNDLYLHSLASNTEFQFKGGTGVDGIFLYGDAFRQTSDGTMTVPGQAGRVVYAPSGDPVEALTLIGTGSYVWGELNSLIAPTNIHFSGDQVSIILLEGSSATSLQQVGSDSVQLIGQAGRLVYAPGGLANAADHLSFWGNSANNTLIWNNLSAATGIHFFGKGGSDGAFLNGANFEQPANGSMKVTGQPGTLNTTHGLDTGLDMIEDLTLVGTSGPNNLVLNSLQSITKIHFAGQSGFDVAYLAAGGFYQPTAGWMTIPGQSGLLVYAPGGDAAEVVVLQGNGADNTAELTSLAYTTNFHFYGGAGNDHLKLTNHTHYTEAVAGMYWYGGQAGAVFYNLGGDPVEFLDFYGTAGNDILETRSFSTVTRVTFYGGAGYDRFGIGINSSVVRISDTPWTYESTSTGVDYQPFYWDINLESLYEFII